MKLIYIAGPYYASSHWETCVNIRIAETMAVWVWRHHAVGICPHKNSAHFSGVVPECDFLNGYVSLLERCDALFLLKGWETSTGSKVELSVARNLNIPTFTRKAKLLEWLENEDVKTG